MKKIKEFINRYPRLIACGWGLIVILLFYRFAVFRKLEETIAKSSRNELAPKLMAHRWGGDVDSILTRDVKMGLYETIDSESEFGVEGWIFNEKNQGIPEDSLYLIMESSQQMWISPLYRFGTSDVASFFHRPDLAQSGFGIRLVKKNLENGVYHAAVLFKNKKTNLTTLFRLGFDIEVKKAISAVKIDRLPQKFSGLNFGLYSIENTGESVVISCWAFPKTGSCASCKTYFTLSSGSSLFSVDAVRTAQPDVVSYFKDPSLLQSGLKTTLSKVSMARGSYHLGILLKDTINQIDYFSETDKLVHIGLNEFVTPEVMKEDTHGTDSIRAFVDGIVDKDDFIQINGWAFINNVSTDSTETSLVLKSKNISYIISTIPELRDDIQGYFHLSYKVDLAGFSVKFKKASVNPGEYRLCIKMLNKKNNSASMLCVNTPIEIKESTNAEPHN